MRITQNTQHTASPLHQPHDVWWLLAFLSIMTLWRFSVLSNMDVSLYIDEAQYWYWANHLDFGYYSKPPMVALLIAATTSLFGDGEVAIRLASIIVYPFSSLLVYLIGQRLFSSRVGLVSAMLFMLMPAVSVSSLVISTDVAFFFFWALGLYALIRALASNAWIWWIVLGLAGGLGMETKYTMGVFVISATAYFLLSAQWRIFLNPRLWLAGILAALIWLPNLIWNYQHEFITFQHTYDISQGNQNLFRWNELFGFLGGQFGVFGIISFALLIYITAKGKFAHKTLLMTFSWTFILIISWQALFGRANANWAAPAFVTASVAVAAWLVNGKYWKWLIAALSLNLILSGGLYYFEPTLKLIGVEQTSRNDIYKRLRGWPELGQQFSKIHEKYPDSILLGAGDRTILAHLAYQARPLKVSTWNDTGRIRHHYDIHNRLDTLTETEFLYVTHAPLEDAVKASFEHSQQLGKLSHTLYPDKKREYTVYLLQNFKGYQP